MATMRFKLLGFANLGGDGIRVEGGAGGERHGLWQSLYGGQLLLSVGLMLR